MLDHTKALSIIKAEGVLSKHFTAFQPRPGQQSMMQAVLNAYEKKAVALIEAGTGIGKSIAYLIPAILWAVATGERTVVSTHTIPLQEQLVKKDVPMLLKALGIEMQVSLVKGMNQYVCLRKWSHIRDTLPLLAPKEAGELLKLEPWVDHLYTQGSSSKGAVLPILPSNTTWELISADRDTCVGKKCPEYERCPFMQERAHAQKAQLLIVNHHLLFSDLKLRHQKPIEEGGLLPHYTRVVLDEAHHLEDIAREHFTEEISQRQAFGLLSRLSGETGGRLSLLRTQLSEWALKQKKQFPEGVAGIQHSLQVDMPARYFDVKEALTRCFLALEEHLHTQTRSAEEQLIDDQLQEVRFRILNEHLTLPIWKETLLPLLKSATQELSSYCATLEGILKACKQLEAPGFDEKSQALRFEIKGYLMRLQDLAWTMKTAQEPVVKHEYVRFLYKTHQARRRDVGLVQAPLDMVKTLQTYLFEPMQTAVLCSATLTTDGNFAFLRSRLGLMQEQLKERCFLEEKQPSPFAYATQALFAIPTDLPEPGSNDFFEKSVEALWKALDVSTGNALVLFTSYRMLLAAYSALKQRCQTHGFPLLRQGDAHRSTLLEALRKNDHSILFATYSFWEGVDVVGDALRCVIIVKLPFPVPNDPLFEAQSELIREQGKNPFMQLALPLAMMRFIQGFGRLIRNQHDRGCVLCLDTRLVNRPYGKRFLDALPPVRQVLSGCEVVWEQMREFYRKTHYLTKL